MEKLGPTQFYDQDLNLHWIFDQNLEKLDAKSPKFNIFRRFKRKISQIMTRYRRFVDYFFIFSLILSLLSSFLQNVSFGGKLQLRKQPPPRPFFPPKSPVVDSFDGRNFLLPHQIASKGQMSVVMCYAPWSRKSKQAKQHFDRLARFFEEEKANDPRRRITFLATNCWDPGGVCRKIYKMYSYPVFMLYSAAYHEFKKPIYYNHVVAADYMYKFLDNALNPLVLYSNFREIEQFFQENPLRILVLTFLNFSNSNTSKLYDKFYETSFKSLEIDPLRDKVHFGVILNISLARNLNLNENGQIRIFGRLESKLDLDTLYNVNESSYDVDSLLQFVYSFKTWPRISNLDLKRIKNEKLFDIYLANQVTVLFFAPRLILRREIFAQKLRILIGRNFDCGRSLADFDWPISMNSSGNYDSNLEKLIDWLGYTVDDDDSSIDSGDFSNLTCKFNRTMQFLLIDSRHYGSMAQNLGLKLTIDGFGMAIVDKDLESVYMSSNLMENGAIFREYKQLLTNFIVGNATRTLKSEVYSEERIEECKVEEICIKRIGSSDFEKFVSTGDEDVILLFQSAWCGACQHLYNVFQNAAFYFGHFIKLKFVTIDADKNDLPWQFTVERYPTIVYFPAKRPADRTVFPPTLPYTLPNLVSFVLSRLSWPTRLKFFFQLCRKGSKCRRRNFQNLEKTLNSLQRRLWRFKLMAKEKFYLWSWVDKDENFGPLVPYYMRYLWREISKMIIKIRSLRRLKVTV